MVNLPYLSKRKWRISLVENKKTHKFPTFNEIVTKFIDNQLASMFCSESASDRSGRIALERSDSANYQERSDSASYRSGQIRQAIGTVGLDKLPGVVGLGKLSTRSGWTLQASEASH